MIVNNLKEQPMSAITGRRKFLKKALGTGLVLSALPAIVPASALGRGAIAPSEKIAMGFIGVGGMGTGHVRSFLQYPDVHVRAVCDVRLEHRLRAKGIVDEQYGSTDCDHYNDFRELLSRPDIDAVLIAVPDHWHALIGMEAALQRKDMYYEKPVCRYFNEALALRDTVKRSGVIFQHGTQQRSDDRFRLACELVRNGRLGKLDRIIAGAAGYSQIPLQPEQPVPEGFDYNFWLGPAPWVPHTQVRCTRHFTLIYDYSLGCISGAWGIHDIDIVQWALDADQSGPTEVEGSGAIAGNGLFDTIGEWQTTHLYPNDVKLIFTDHVSARKNLPEYKLNAMGLVFIGSEGWVAVSRELIEAHPKSILREPIGSGEIRLPRSADHRRNFLDAVRTRQQAMCPVDIAVRSEAVCQQADIAIRLGRKLNWDPKTERFVNDEAANRMLTGVMRSPWYL